MDELCAEGDLQPGSRVCRRDDRSRPVALSPSQCLAQTACRPQPPALPPPTCLAADLLPGGAFAALIAGSRLEPPDPHAGKAPLPRVGVKS